MSKPKVYLWRLACRLLVTAYTGVLISPAALPAQMAVSSQLASTQARLPAYDVVSIKPNKTGSGQVDVWIDDGNFTASNVSLKTLILSAYGLKDPQLINLPKWGESARFDIKAKIIDPDKKALAALAPGQFQAMQQPMLTDRFQLKFHHELKILPVYELVVIKGGAKFKEAAAADVVNTGTHINNGKLVGTGVTMSSLADSLSGQVQRIVVDRTGLTGKYNLQLSWSRDDAGPSAPDSVAPPDMFTALQEQLGLKLQPGKQATQTFVVDHAELPSAV